MSVAIYFLSSRETTQAADICSHIDDLEVCLGAKTAPHIVPFVARNLIVNVLNNQNELLSN